MKSMINLVNWKKKGKILIEIELNNTGQSMMMMMIVIENERNNLDYWTIFYNSISVKIEKKTNMNVVEERKNVYEKYTEEKSKMIGETFQKEIIIHEKNECFWWNLIWFSSFFLIQ